MTIHSFIRSRIDNRLPINDNDSVIVEHRYNSKTIDVVFSGCVNDLYCYQIHEHLLHIPVKAICYNTPRKTLNVEI